MTWRSACSKWCCFHLLLGVLVVAYDGDFTSGTNFLAADYDADALAALQLVHTSQKHQRSKASTNAIDDWRKRISSLLDKHTESPLLRFLQQPTSVQETSSSSQISGPYPLQSMNEKDAVVKRRPGSKLKKVGDEEDMRIAFDAFDKDHDHGISLSEFAEMMRSLLDSREHHMLPQPKFDVWDESGDGRIDLLEFSKALQSAKVGHEYLPVFKRLTAHGPIDRKKLGMLLNHELHGRADITDEQLHAILKENGGRPESNPIVDSLAQLTPIMDSIVAFQLVDRDDNGYLSGPELSSFLQTMNPGTSDGTVLLQADDGPGDEDGNGQIAFFDFYALTHSSAKT